MATTKGTVPVRGVAHDRFSVWVGDWHAEGESYASGQVESDPRGSVETWVSDESIAWLPGHFFIARRTDGRVGSRAISGLDVFSVDPDTGAYTTRGYENHGFLRDYVTRVDGAVWTFTGETERARVEFSEDGDTQTVCWEWRKPGGVWLPLCDRVARRVRARISDPPAAEA